MKSVPLSEFMPYGAPELLGSSRRHMLQALMLSSALCALGFAAVGVVLMRMPHPVIVYTPEILPKKHPVEPPPLIVPEHQVRVPVVRPPDIAIPVPVPAVDPHAPVTIDSGNRTGTDTGRSTIRGGEPDVGVNRGDREDPLPPPDQYVYFDELPAVARQVDPEYPELAKMAHEEGTVVLRLLVGTDGHVRQVLVDPKHSIALLNDAAVTAARQWMFQPARANGHPVAVWVAVPFRFKLN